MQFLPGCGPARAEMLARLGVTTVRDLVFLFPRSYHDLTAISTIDTLEEGQPTSIVGVVDEVELQSRGMRPLGPRRAGPAGFAVPAGAVVQSTVYAGAVSRRPASCCVSGKPKFFGNRWQMTHPEVKNLDEAELARRADCCRSIR